jgi:hypothetical protein
MMKQPCPPRLLPLPFTTQRRCISATVPSRLSEIAGFRLEQWTRGQGGWKKGSQPNGMFSRDRRWTLRKENQRSALSATSWLLLHQNQLFFHNHKQQSRAIAVTNSGCVVFGMAVDTSTSDFTGHLSAWSGEPSSPMSLSGSTPGIQNMEPAFLIPNRPVRSFLALHSLVDVCWCTATLMPISEACLELCTHHTRPLLISVRSAP